MKISNLPKSWIVLSIHASFKYFPYCSAFSSYCNNRRLYSVTVFFPVVVSLLWLCSLCSRYCTDLYTSWTENVCECSQYNLSLPLISRDSVTGLISVNFNQQVFFSLFFPFIRFTCLTTWLGKGGPFGYLSFSVSKKCYSLFRISTVFFLWGNETFSDFFIILPYAFHFFHL